MPCIRRTRPPGARYSVPEYHGASFRSHAKARRWAEYATEGPRYCRDRGVRRAKWNLKFSRERWRANFPHKIKALEISASWEIVLTRCLRGHLAEASCSLRRAEKSIDPFTHATFVGSNLTCPDPIDKPICGAQCLGIHLGSPDKGLRNLWRRLAQRSDPMNLIQFILA